MHPIRLILASVCLSALVSPSPSSAASLPHERQIDALTERVVSLVAAGQAPEALDLLADHGAERDTALKSSLERSRELSASAPNALGPVSSVARLEPTYFAGCQTERFRIRRANGTQDWQMKFRRTTEGWQLKDLLIRQ